MGLKFKPRIGPYTPFKLDDKRWCVMNRRTGEVLLDHEYAHRKWAVNKANQLNEGESKC